MGNKVRGYRMMLGMSQHQMGIELGISKQSYYKKEKGISQFKDIEKVRFKEMLKSIFPDITIDDIFF
ncbi:transcriptional regulator [uncultured Abiotrophia sp.]|uniref:helix-turn-helix transcriptional regulator n=1 Tax=uncultured Abiotrophia sp. TaxID=316094 RepID=UPI0028D7C59C|nr:transcriptional regulator [uncultured Abiotrophia sp.]